VWVWGLRFGVGFGVRGLGFAGSRRQWQGFPGHTLSVQRGGSAETGRDIVYVCERGRQTERGEGEEGVGVGGGGLQDLQGHVRSGVQPIKEDHPEGCAALRIVLVTVPRKKTNWNLLPTPHTLNLQPSSWTLDHDPYSPKP